MAKLSRKDKKTYQHLLKKIDEIVNNPDIEHYKNLRYTMKDSKRVHIGSFVLVFQHDKSKDEINFD